MNRGNNSRSSHHRSNYPTNRERTHVQIDSSVNLPPAPDPIPTTDSSRENSSNPPPLSPPTTAQPIQPTQPTSQTPQLPPQPSDAPVDKPVPTDNPQEIDGSVLNQDKVESIGTSDNLRILYITIAIIVGLLLVWLIIMFFTKEDPIKVLGDMTDPTTQIKPVSDLQPVISSISSTISDIPI
jgi:hypothetical protein